MAESPIDRIPTRQTVIDAANIFKALTHAGFEQALLEFGLPEEVGQGSGLQARAVSLAKYAVGNPAQPTAEGVPVAQAIVQRAAQIFMEGETSKKIAEEDRRKFQTSLAREGWLGALDARIYEKPIPTNQGTTWREGSVTRFNPFFPPPAAARSPEPIKAAAPRPRRVFVVHGHDGEAKADVRRFLERADFEAVVLHGQPNRGRTLITKFREEAATVGYAVVLMTPDDYGGKVGAEPQPRARQNVVFELGFFISALGPDRVAALVKGNVEHPSEFDAVVYIELDRGGGWKQELGRELEAAGFEIDWKKAMRS